MKNEAKSQNTSAPISSEGAAEVTSLPMTRRYKELFVVEDRPDGRGGFWTKVGVAFETKNGNYSLKLSALPIGHGRIIMMDPKPKEAAANDNREARQAA